MLDCDAITDKLLQEIKIKIEQKYTGQGDFVDLNRDVNDRLKITGFKHLEIKIEISKIIDKVKAYNFPRYWEDTIELLTSDTQVMTKRLDKSKNEWEQLEATFMLTMPKAKIKSIKRIQNKRLWKVYQCEVEAVAEKHGNV